MIVVVLVGVIALVAGLLLGRMVYRWELHRAVRHAALTIEPSRPIDHDAVFDALRGRREL